MRGVVAMRLDQPSVHVTRRRTAELSAAVRAGRSELFTRQFPEPGHRPSLACATDAMDVPFSWARFEGRSIILQANGPSPLVGCARWPLLLRLRGRCPRTPPQGRPRWARGHGEPALVDANIRHDDDDLAVGRRVSRSFGCLVATSRFFPER